MKLQHSVYLHFHRNTRRRKRLRFLISQPSTSSTIHKVTDSIPSLRPFFNKPVFSLINDVHHVADFAEKLLKQLEGSKERFEVKIMLMELISRLVGIHEVNKKEFLFTIQTGRSDQSPAELRWPLWSSWYLVPGLGWPQRNLIWSSAGALQDFDGLCVLRCLSAHRGYMVWLR